MIVDITNEVFDNLKRTLTDVTVLKKYPSTSPVFPCLTFQEVLNSTNMETHDSAGDHHSAVVLEINIFSNSETDLTEIKSIRDRVDAIMADGYNMNREDSRPIEVFSDSKFSQYLLRYSFLIDSNKTIYRR